MFQLEIVHGSDLVDTVYRLPIPTRALKAQVHAYAESAALKLGFKPGAPIEPLISSLGGRIRYREAVHGEFPEAIRVEPNRKFTVFLTSVTSYERDRFTIAHELGHLLLHFPLVTKAHPGSGMEASRWVDENDVDQQRAEWEANWFAAAFVMPEPDFRDAVAKFSSTADIASRFGVSSKAAEIRAKSLGL